MALIGDKMKFRLILAALLMGIFVQAAVVNYTYIEQFEPNVQIVNGEAHVDIPGGYFIIHGEPDLPGKPIRLALPPGTEATDVEYSVDSEILASTVEVRNAFLSELDNPWEKAAPFASVEMPPVQLDGTSMLYGVPMAELFIRPVTYDPETGELIWNRRIDIDVETRQSGDNAFKFPQLTPLSSKIREHVLTNAVENPIDLPPRPRPMDFSELVYPTRSFPPSPGDDKCDGVVITADEYVETLQPIKDEINFGVILEIVPISQITSGYIGSSDRAQKLRRFIKDAYEHWGISGVFLVGDHTQIPVRFRHGMTPNSPNYLDIPSDLYYTALDGDWNSDNDAYFGEEDDDDFAPDIIIGRFPAEDTSEVRAYLDKINYHRWEVDFDFTTRWLMMGASIQGTDYSGPIQCDSIITAGPIPHDVDIYKLYAFHDSTGGDTELTEANARSQLTEGKYIAFHLDHGFRYILHTGKHTDHGSGFDIPEFMAMDNGPYYPFLHTYSCEVNSFDVGCVGSASVRSKNGGFVGILAHSRSAYSNHKQLIHYFWGDNFLPSGRTANLGAAVQGTQIDYGISTTGKYYKSILNYLGYPFLDMYLGQPTRVEVDLHTPTLTSTDSIIRLEVFKESTSTPYEGANVVAYTPSGAYAMVQTDASGAAMLIIEPESAEEIILTVSGNGAFPWTDTISVITSGSEHVVLNKNIFYPGGGDHDNIPEPGDTFACALILKNIGAATAESINVDIEVPGLIDTTAIIPAIAPAEYCTLAAAFGLEIDPSLRGTRNLRPVVIISTENQIEHDTLALALYGPEFEHTTTFYVDDNDGIPEAGETGTLAIAFANIGPGDFHGGVIDIEMEGAVPYSTHFEIGDISSNTQDTLHIPIDIESHYIIADIYFTFSNTTPESIDINYTKPPAPDSLRMTPREDEIWLFWQPPLDSNIIGYNVYRGDSLADNFVKINEIPIEFSTLIDEGLPHRTRFHYYVIALDEWYNESYTSDTILAWTTLPLMEPWPIQIGLSREIYSSLAIEDADGNGDLEIYAVGKKYSAVWAFHHDGIPVIEGDDMSDPFRVISWDGTTVSELGMWSSPAIGEVFPGRTHILINDRTFPSKAYLLDAINAEDATGWPTNAMSASMGNPVLADLDGDNTLELLNPNHDGLNVWNRDGSSYIPGAEGVFADFEDGMTDPLWGSPAVGDINGDGEVEIVMGFGADEANNGTLYAFDHNGETLPGWPIRMRNNDFTNINPTLANFDSDTTTLEILIAAYRGGAYIFDHEGDSLEGWPITEFSQLFYESHTAAADFDGDGICEAVLTGINEVGVYRADGTPMPGWPIDVDETGQTVGNPTIGDLNGDGQWDIVFSMSKRIYAYDIYGNMLPGFPLVIPDLCPGSPNLCDIDGDGYIEIATGAMDSYIYVWRTGVPYTEESVAWPTEKGNYHRTGLYGEHWRIMPVTENSNSTPDRLSISTYPNPFNSSVRIAIDAGGKLNSPVRVEIYDVSGRKIDEFSSPSLTGEKEVSRSLFQKGEFTNGPDEVLVWRPDKSLPSGIYLVRASIAGRYRAARLVYLK